MTASDLKSQATGGIVAEYRHEMIRKWDKVYK